MSKEIGKLFSKKFSIDVADGEFENESAFSVNSKNPAKVTVESLHLHSEVSKLFPGGKVKKHARNDFNFEGTTQKMQALSYFDQHVVTYQCSTTVVEMLSSFAIGKTSGKYSFVFL